MTDKKPFLESEEIYLREFQKEDIYNGYQDWINDPDVNNFLDVGSFPQPLESLENYYNAHIDNKNIVMFAIIEKETGKHIGNARVYGIKWVHRCGSRGIMIGDKSAWGKGYGLQVINLVSKYAFEILNLNKLSSVTVGGNVGIHKVNERAGYKKEGVIRELFYRDGKYYDAYYYGLTKTDYCENIKPSLDG